MKHCLQELSFEGDLGTSSSKHDSTKDRMVSSVASFILKAVASLTGPISLNIFIIFPTARLRKLLMVILFLTFGLFLYALRVFGSVFDRVIPW